MSSLSTAFPTFSQTHTEFEKYSSVSNESIDFFMVNANPKLLPEVLVQFWSEYGVGKFSSGLFFVCDPLEKKPIMKYFLPDKDLYPLCISSFGNILFTDMERIYFLSPVYGWFNYNSPDFEMIFEGTLIDKDFISNAFDFEFHKKCVKKLGCLAQNEIFGFEPAIALGGNDEDVNMVKKFQMEAHLAFLSQLVELEER
jgi:hypothetical protein